MKDTSNASQPERTSMASTKADLRELRNNSSATVRELQDFLNQLRGKSPQEMLGVVTSSQLFRAIALSLILVTVAIFVLTAIPYFFGEEPTPANTSEAVVTEPAPSKAGTPAPPQPKTSNTAEPKKPVELAPLGVNEKRTAPANTNPLEDKEDDFLKDLE